MSTVIAFKVLGAVRLQCVLQTIIVASLICAMSCIYRALSFRSYCLEFSRSSKLTNGRQINSSRTKTSASTKLARTGEDGKSEWEASRSEKRRVKRNKSKEEKSICMCNKDEKTKKNVTVREKFARAVSRFSKNSSTFQLQNAPQF